MSLQGGDNIEVSCFVFHEFPKSFRTGEVYPNTIWISCLRCNYFVNIAPVCSSQLFLNLPFQCLKLSFIFQSSAVPASGVYVLSLRRIFSTRFLLIHGQETLVFSILWEMNVWMPLRRLSPSSFPLSTACLLRRLTHVLLSCPPPSRQSGRY